MIVSSALALPPKDTAPPEIGLPFCSSEMRASPRTATVTATNFVTLHAARKDVNRFAVSLVDVDAIGRERNGRRLLTAQDSDRGRIRIVNAAAVSLRLFRSSSVHEHERNLFIPEPGHFFRLDPKHVAFAAVVGQHPRSTPITYLPMASGWMIVTSSVLVPSSLSSLILMSLPTASGGTTVSQTSCLPSRTPTEVLQAVVAIPSVTAWYRQEADLHRRDRHPHLPSRSGCSPRPSGCRGC